MARYNPIPPGWHECPPIGNVSDQHQLIPIKVPLGNNRRFPNLAHLSGGSWTPSIALQTAYGMVQQRKGPEATIGLVIDLSNSDKYYDPNEFMGQQVNYVKVPCRGRGCSPDPLAVNMAVFEMRKALEFNPNAYILVHCTHGYNRSGFVIVCALMRLLSQEGYCVERLLRRFAAQRPPGIYKHDYISALFKRHNELRPKQVLTPPLPGWKPADDEDEDERLGVGSTQPEGQVSTGRITHSDKVGEPVSVAEARWVMCLVYDMIVGQDMRLKGETLAEDGFPHYRVYNRSNGDLFVGSQPVSLDAENLELIKMKRCGMK
eukprot:GHRR01017100.1.p1 GENE.GHRR01017100.1~~GHRR01017100.1.p1  ORF type:complete len:318 (+),score=60.02 GHRR01017100.1:324-1277(+)